MRKRIWITCIIILAVSLFLLFKAKQQHKTVVTEQHEALTNFPGQVPQAPIVNNHQISSTPIAANSFVNNAVAASTSPTESNAIDPRVLALWQVPIEFYGKVIDENSNSVAGVSIHFRWSEKPSDDGMMTSDTESDSEGLFSLRGKKGRSLTVWFSKDGYSSLHGQKSFNYALGPDIISPDPQNPVIFLVHKNGQGVELITSENGMRSDVWVRVPKDNTPVRVDFFQKQASPTGQLEISQNKPPFQEATNWSFSLSIPDGGLIENQDEFQYLAPESGYQQTMEYDFTKSAPNWTSQVAKQFYIAFGQPRKYGWLRIESSLTQQTVFLTYAINPDGTRNLEPTH